MLRAFQIELNKLITLICKIFKKNGSVFPGSITYNINQRILEKIKYPKYVIAVTGSSGKGSTTSLIAHALKNAGYDVIYNESGSNGIRAITTLILNHCNIFGRFKHDVLLLEVDEKHLHLAFGKNKPTHLVLTNITRDQTARNGSPDLVYESIMNAIDQKTTIILNADDPGLQKTQLNFKGKIITYGINKTKDSYTTSKNKSVDNAYCPICHKKLIYKYYHYGHIGNYYCKNCDFKRGTPDYEATNVNLDDLSIKINQTDIHLNKNILYVAYATTAAFALCDTIGIKKEDILYAFNKNEIAAKRGHQYKIANRNITMLESKNENPLSYYQSLKYITNEHGKKTVILGFDNVSRRYKYNDLSWLWDVEFELLNDEEIDSILCIGRFKYDVATRLSYAGIKNDKLILVEDLTNLLNIIKEKTKGNIYTMVCFDMTAIIHQLIKEDEHGNN
jgi:UDP-N-acetylmuramyl tripeptide synthase